MKWLYEEDNYIPQGGREAFINKSILSFVGILSKIKRSNLGNRKGALYETNAVIKLLSTLVIVILLSLGQNPWFLALSGGLLIMSLFLTNREDVKKIAVLSLAAALFTFVILVPSMMTGNIKNSIILISKVLITVGFVNLLSFTTKWHDVTKTLRLFFIPDIFILILDMTIRYIYLLGSLSLDMLHALKKRTIGSDRKKYRTLSGIIGNLFLKSVETGNEAYYAMACRGFTGEYKSQPDNKITVKDAPYLFMVLVLLSAYFYIGGK